MWLLYVVAMILGGGVLFVQMLSGAGHDVGGHDISLEGAHPDAGPGLVSTRSATFGIAAFGLVGAPLQLLQIVGPVTTFAIAFLSAVVAAATAGFAFARLGHPAASGSVSFGELVGREAKVLVACSRSQRGKIRVSLGGQVIDVLATTDDEGAIAPGTEVRILEVRDDVAHIATGGRTHA
jgi:membrane protein implicated in regulation of membrane protease activity